MEAEKFRREKKARRDWGLEQRHSRKLRRLYGSTAAAWAAYQDRADEVLSPVRSGPAGQAGPPARAGSGIVTETPPAGPALVLPEAALPEAALPEAALPEAALPEAALPLVTTSAQAQCIPAVSEASVPKAVRTESATAEPIRPPITPSGPALPRTDSSASPTRVARLEFEPVVAEPVVAEPVVAEPVVAEPVVAEPVVAEPPSTRWAAGALTAFCLPCSNFPARRSRPGSAGRCRAGRPTVPCPAGKRRPGQVRQRCREERRQAPSATCTRQIELAMKIPARRKPIMSDFLVACGDIR
jgi:hypothetical protein